MLKSAEYWKKANKSKPPTCKQGQSHDEETQELHDENPRAVLVPQRVATATKRSSSLAAAPCCTSAHTLRLFGGQKSSEVIVGCTSSPFASRPKWRARFVQETMAIKKSIHEYTWAFASSKNQVSKNIYLSFASMAFNWGGVTFKRFINEWDAIGPGETIVLESSGDFATARQSKWVKQ